MTAPVPVTVRFTGNRIGRHRSARPLNTTVAALPDGTPDWDRLCEEVHRHASHYLLSREVDAYLYGWDDPDNPPPPGTRHHEGHVYIGGLRRVATWYLTAPPRTGKKNPA